MPIYPEIISREISVISAFPGIEQTPITELANRHANQNEGQNVENPMPSVEYQAIAAPWARMPRQVTFGIVSSQELPSTFSWTTDAVFISSKC